LWAIELVSRREEFLVHAGIQAVEHQAHSLFTILTIVPRAFNKMEVKKVTRDGQS